MTDLESMCAAFIKTFRQHFIDAGEPEDMSCPWEECAETDKELTRKAMQSALSVLQQSGWGKVADDVYLVWSHEHSAWWRPKRCGYTTSFLRAGRYTRAEAISICESCRDGWCAHGVPSEIPVREADALACDEAFKRKLPSSPNPTQEG